MNNNFSSQIEKMEAIADMLLPLTFPRVSFEEEQEIIMLKQHVVQIDGYYVVLCYSKTEYPRYLLKTIQIQSVYTPFLPFALVCKIGRRFLGSKHLSYVEFLRGSRKVYCWTVKIEEGQAMPPGRKTKPGSYEGFDYRILNPGSVDLH
jgi:hypothetical protein